MDREWIQGWLTILGGNSIDVGKFGLVNEGPEIEADEPVEIAKLELWNGKVGKVNPREETLGGEILQKLEIGHLGNDVDGEDVGIENGVKYCDVQPLQHELCEQRVQNLVEAETVDAGQVAARVQVKLAAVDETKLLGIEDAANLRLSQFRLPARRRRRRRSRHGESSEAGCQDLGKAHRVKLWEQKLNASVFSQRSGNCPV